MPRDADGLTPRKRTFVTEYAVDGNGQRAAEAAGCPANSARVTASRWLTDANVRAALEKIQAKHAEEAGTTVAWVLAALKENAERGLQRVPVLDAEGKPTGVWKWEGTVANKALELIGKHRGMFTEKVQHDVTVNVEQALASVDDDPAG